MYCYNTRGISRSGIWEFSLLLSLSIPKFTANGMLFKKRPADGARVTCVVELPLLQASGGFDLHPLAPAFPLGKVKSAFAIVKTLARQPPASI